MPYGKELVLDIHDCNPDLFNRIVITTYLEQLCNDVIHMEREDLHWWDYEDDPEGYALAPAHLKGTSCCQFILTSTIVIHTLVDLKKMFVNIFTCKDFDEKLAADFTARWFQGVVAKATLVERI